MGSQQRGPGRVCELAGVLVASHSRVSHFPRGLNTEIQRANMDSWVQVLKVAKSSGGEPGHLEGEGRQQRAD